ncbi:MAG TPA: glycosyltransferase family 2 protein [Thermodesulfovibrionales bacterium]|nr:glycosyltransferase family 2 protein [Thermodesulfovibrionales bacterium]
MKLSLIITTYNTPLALGKVTDSVMDQIRQPDEVLIADDGSGDDTAVVVQGFSERAPVPVFHVWQENRGFRAAKIRNEAIKRSSGDYLVLLDGDCVVNRHFLSDHLALAEKGCFIQGKRVHVHRKMVAAFGHGHANSASELMKMALLFHISNIHHLIRLPLFRSVRNTKLKGIKSCNMSFFRDDIMAVNGFNEDFVGWGNEDSELACRFFKYGLKKKVHPFMAICFHLWHPTNKTTLNGNKDLLQATIESKGYFCRNGLFKNRQ